MKGHRIFLLATAIFLALSALFYYIHYLIFHDPHHIFIYMLGDFSFLPLEVLVVVIVIERVLARREKQSMLYKLNMAIGAFFSEVGNYLLSDLIKYFGNQEEISRHLNLTKDWTDKDFKEASAYAYNLKTDIDMATRHDPRPPMPLKNPTSSGMPSILTVAAR